MTDYDYDRAVQRQREERNPPAPPFGCTEGDLREGPTADERCPACQHPKRDHGFDGCDQRYQIAKPPNYVLGPEQRCGCQEWDPLCTAVASGEESKATVVRLGSEGESRATGGET